MPKKPPSAPSPEPKNPSLPSTEFLARYAREFNKSSTLRYFGVQIAFPDQRTIEARVDTIMPEHRGGLGTSAVNGGVLAAIFDLVIGCTSALFDPTRRSATMHLSMSFERPVFGDSLRAEGRIDSAGSSVLFSSARMFDGDGVECARCQGLVRVSRLPWASGQSPAVDGQT
jgi:acyl-coenzyme A thioesterase PaaI-like protein